MRLSKYVKQYRLSHNMTQEEFAKKSELTQTQVSLIESDELPVGFKLVKKLADSLELTEEKVREML